MTNLAASLPWPTMTKPLVFISHIHEERDLAVALKDLIEETFLGMLETFVSSDDKSITSGAKWLDQITNALKTCAVEVILCSPVSIGRPWINFEAGAGWIRDVPVIPICHSGLSLGALPIPLSLLDGSDATDAVRLTKVLGTMATAIGANLPKNLDLTSFVTTATNFETNYTFWRKVNDAFHAVKGLHPSLLPGLVSGNDVDIQLPDGVITPADPALNYLATEDILSGVRNGVSMGPSGTSYLLQVRRLAKFAAIVGDSRFKP